MIGIDAEGSFDPTEGENPALTRNNLGEVWNQQVSVLSCCRNAIAKGRDGTVLHSVLLVGDVSFILIALSHRNFIIII